MFTGRSVSSNFRGHKTYSLFRPPDILVSLLIGFTTILLLSFFVTYPPELAERNSIEIGHVPGSKCDLKMHVQNLGSSLSLQIGGLKTMFFDDRHRNLAAN